VIDVQARLTSADLPLTVQRLGFRGDDVPGVLTAAAAAAESPDALSQIGLYAERLVGLIGVLPGTDTADPWEGIRAQATAAEAGVVAILTLVVTAPEVGCFHRGRGIADDISWRSLADLGQQVWVHRQTFGEFGLHTYDWLCIVWCGALYWLGRLQFNLQLDGDEWVLSTHIPATGPLTRGGVDDSFRAATEFFASHFADYPTQLFYCSSWLLDPELAKALPSGSNMADFQRRWKLYGEAMQGDADALFFTFYRRGPVDLDTLPRQTTLQRAILDRLKAGQHWSVWQGRIPQPGVGSLS
jgi:hypothetical protein